MIRMPVGERDRMCLNGRTTSVERLVFFVDRGGLVRVRFFSFLLGSIMSLGFAGLVGGEEGNLKVHQPQPNLGEFFEISL